jgi:type IV secretory pathway VirB6-like protein
MGTSELNHSEIMNRIIKIGIIYLFIGETGWDWFNNLVVRFFKNGTDYLAFMMASSFDSSSNHAVSDAIANSDYYDKSVLFSSVDNVFSMFFSQAVQKKVSALLFASIFGWVYLIIIYQSFMLYVYSVANAVLLYLTAQVFISILFTLGPIFLIFTLFSQTKEMFDNWLKQLIGFSLQQIFLLTTLAFFNMLMYEVIKLSLGYKICWDEVWTINIITRITLLSFWTIASLPARTNAQSDVGNIGNPEGIPSLFSILFIWVIASLMNKFIGFMTDLAATISGGLSASSLGKGIADAVKGASDMAKKGRQELWNKTGGQVTQRIDKALFNSGAMADKERNERKANNAKDFSNKSAMAKAGNKAKQDYINKNKVALSGMSKDEQRKTLKGVEDAAQTKAGKDLGLNDKDIDRLKKDKGFKFEGDTLGGAAASALQQRFMGGKTLNESLSDKSSDLKLSVDQASGKGLSTEDAKTLKDNIAKGNVDVEKLSENCCYWTTIVLSTERFLDN